MWNPFTFSRRGDRGVGDIWVSASMASLRTERRNGCWWAVWTCKRDSKSCFVCLLLFSRVQPSATPWTAAHQAPLSMGLSRQEYCSGLPFPSPGIFPDHGSNLSLLDWQAYPLPLNQQGSLVSYGSRWFMNLQRKAIILVLHPFLFLNAYSLGTSL